MSDRISTLDQLWASSPSAEGVLVPLEYQGFLATILIIFALSLSAIFTVTEKQSIGGISKCILVGIMASLSFGFGGVYLIDAVGVYT